MKNCMSLSLTRNVLRKLLCGYKDRGNDPHNLICFSGQPIQTLWSNKSGFGYKAEPVSALPGLFVRD